MILELIQDDIDNGIKKSYTECPLALCLKRTYKEVEVKNFKVTVDGRVLYMGADLQRFVENFDDGLPVKPLSVPISEPCQIVMPSNLNLGTR